MLVGSIGQRPGNQDFSLRIGHGQDAVVFEEDGRFLCGATGGIQILGSILRCGALLRVHIRVLEQSQAEFYAQDIANGGVNLGFFYHAALYQFFHVGEEAEGHHIHIHSGLDGLGGGFLAVLGEAMLHHLAHGIPVGDHQAVKAPFATEDLFHQPAVTGRGNAVVVVEGGHESEGTGIYGRFKCREIGVV